MLKVKTGQSTKANAAEAVMKAASRISHRMGYVE